MANPSPARVACSMTWRRAGVRPGCAHRAACGQDSSPARVPSAASTWMRTPSADAVTVSRAPLPGSPGPRSPECGATRRIAGFIGWPSMTASKSVNTSKGSLPRPRQMSSSVSGLPGSGRALSAGAGGWCRGVPAAETGTGPCGGSGAAVALAVVSAPAGVAGVSGGCAARAGASWRGEGPAGVPAGAVKGNVAWR